MAEQEHKRYPGTRPFLDDKFDRMLFKGRTKEIQQLLHLILAENLVVLFAKSGVGKSSLLNAGVFKPLREKKYFPIRIRMNDPDSNFIEVIDDEAKSVAKNYNIDAATDDKKSESLWQYFKTTEFWSEKDELLTPVLVFDQFEEIFTLGYSQEQRKEFFLQLADLVLGRTPESIKKNISQKEKSYLEKPPNIKVVISMREDFLAELEEMATDIPSILRNRFRLQALTIEQAREAIEEPARLENEDLATKQFSYDEDAVSTILKFLSRRETPSDIQSGDNTRFWSWKIMWILAFIVIVPANLINLLTKSDLWLDVSGEAIYVALVALCICAVTFIILAIIRPIKFKNAFLTSFIFLFACYGISILMMTLGNVGVFLAYISLFILFSFIILSLIVSVISLVRLKRKIKRIKVQTSIYTNSIEPFQLQLLCQYIEEKVLPDLKPKDSATTQIVVKAEDFHGEEGIQRILEDFYNNKVKELKSNRFQRAVRKLCEKGLISPTERRLPLAEESIKNQYKIPIEILNQLIEFRLLRKEPKLGSSIYELCHDSMVKPILVSSKKRKRKQLKYSLIPIASIAIILVGFIIIKNIQAAQLEEDRWSIYYIDYNNKTIKTIINNDTLTVVEKRNKLIRYKNYSDQLVKSLHSDNYTKEQVYFDLDSVMNEKATIDHLISDIDSICQYYAIIENSKEFILDKKFPPKFEANESYRFTQRDTIYISAKIKYTQTEQLSFDWKDNEGLLISTDSITIVKPDSIIHVRKLAEYPGNYEVQFSNSQDYLIGRQTFRIEGFSLINNEAINILNDNSLTITKKLERLEINRKEAKATQNLSSFVVEQNMLISKKMEELDIAISRYATIGKSGDFVVCENIQKFMPTGINNNFSPGRVYVWANIRAPQNETVTVNWLDNKGNILSSNKYSITADLAGYRVYDSRTFFDAGNYEVRLNNSNNNLIGIQKFKIEKVTRQIKK